MLPPSSVTKDKHLLTLLYLTLKKICYRQSVGYNKQFSLQSCSMLLKAIPTVCYNTWDALICRYTDGLQIITDYIHMPILSIITQKPITIAYLSVFPLPGCDGMLGFRYKLTAESINWDKLDHLSSDNQLFFTWSWTQNYPQLSTLVIPHCKSFVLSICIFFSCKWLHHIWFMTKNALYSILFEVLQYLLFSHPQKTLK